MKKHIKIFLCILSMILTYLLIGTVVTISWYKIDVESLTAVPTEFCIIWNFIMYGVTFFIIPLFYLIKTLINKS